MLAAASWRDPPTAVRSLGDARARRRWRACGASTRRRASSSRRRVDSQTLLRRTRRRRPASKSPRPRRSTRPLGVDQRSRDPITPDALRMPSRDRRAEFGVHERARRRAVPAPPPSRAPPDRFARGVSRTDPPDSAPGRQLLIRRGGARHHETRTLFRRRLLLQARVDGVATSTRHPRRARAASRGLVAISARRPSSDAGGNGVVGLAPPSVANRPPPSPPPPIPPLKPFAEQRRRSRVIERNAALNGAHTEWPVASATSRTCSPIVDGGDASRIARARRLTRRLSARD